MKKKAKAAPGVCLVWEFGKRFVKQEVRKLGLKLPPGTLPVCCKGSSVRRELSLSLHVKGSLSEAVEFSQSQQLSSRK